MEAQDLTFDINRRYINDRQCTLPPDVANTLAGWNRSRDYQRLAGCVSSFPQALAEGEAARTLFQIESFFSKNDSFTDPVAAKLSALISFEESELLCQQTNERLDEFYEGHTQYASFSNQIRSCQRYIDKVLGPFRLFLDDLPKNIRYTAGATATLARKDALPFFKVSKKISCTYGALPYLETLSKFFGYGRLVGRITSRNRVEFVPKSWKTLRTIACEPSGNMPLQLAFDKYGKQRLRRVGVNLHDQTLNQELSRIASIDGSLATIDMKGASDTVSYNVVALLFPFEWFNYLRAVRSSSYELYPGLIENYAKFSSMGNGATFSIETLVFAAACKAVGSKRFSVYGDDIIIETELVDDLIALLAFLGFTVNQTKSFTSGPIRESCGKVWHNGLDITPLYLRKVDQRKPILCHIVNQMAKISRPGGELAILLAKITISEKLLLVPLCEDTMSGVWITPHDAYERKVIRTIKKPRRARFHTPLSLQRDEANGVKTDVQLVVPSPWIPKYLAYQPKDNGFVECYDSRALFLWHLRAFSKESNSFPAPLPSFIWDKHQVDDWAASVDESLAGLYRPERLVTDNQVSRHTHATHRYVKKWVRWQPVVFGATINQTRFMELLLHLKYSSGQV